MEDNKHSLLYINFFDIKWIAVLLLTLLVMLPSPSVLAEDKNTPQKQDRESVALDSITVTAQKQEENVQDVPISISVLDSTLIEDAGIDTLVDLSNFIPNLFLYKQSPGNNLPTMRGISAPVETYQVSTGLYIDGAPIITTTGFTTGLLDIERIEVLRGPQGTLYGNGAQAGVINIITRRPSNEFTGKISTEAGSWLSSEADYLLAKTSMYISGPIVKDKLSFSATGQFEHKDGYIQNTLTDEAENGRQNWFGKVNFYWSPTDKLYISLIASHMDNNTDNLSFVLTDLGYAAFGLQSPGYRKTTSDLTEQYYDTTEDMQTLKVDYNLTDELTLTSVTTNWRSDGTWYTDYDFTPYIISHYDTEIESTRLSEELRLSYTKGKLKGLAGFYWDTYERKMPVRVDSMYAEMQTQSEDDISGDTYAVFGNLTYPVTEKLSVGAGLRYESSEQDFEEKFAGTQIDGSWDAITPKFSLNYAITSTAMTYVNVAKGYRPGGFNASISISTSEYNVYNSEELWSYEAGTKISFLDNKLIFNTALFYMDINDMQVVQLPSDGGSQSYLTNAGEATSKGLELEIMWFPAQGLTLSAGFGYTDVTFDKFSDAAGDYEGNKNPWAPEYTFNLGAQYRHQSGWYARADVIGVGEMFLDKANQYSVDPYVLVDVKIGYELESFDIYLYGKNIFDEEHDYEYAYGGYYHLLNDPGEVGIQLTYRF